MQIYQADMQEGSRWRIVRYILRRLLVRRFNEGLARFLSIAVNVVESVDLQRY